MAEGGIPLVSFLNIEARKTRTDRCDFALTILVFQFF